MPFFQTQSGWSPKQILIEIFAVVSGLIGTLLRGLKIPIAVFAAGFVAGFGGTLIYGGGLKLALFLGLVGGAVCVVGMGVLWLAGMGGDL